MSEPSKCVVYDNGTKYWHNEAGDFHRDGDLPAIEYAEGDKWWCVNGNLHRLLGPAVIWPDGYKAWWVDGKKIECTTQEEFERLMKLRAFW